MELNISWVTDTLALGGSFAKEAIPWLAAEQRIGHVVDLRSEARDDDSLLRDHGIELLHLPTLDHHPLSCEMLDAGVAWVALRCALGQKVYIHCEHGIGRSVLLTWCVLVRQGEAPLDALRRIKRARPCASPSPAQIDALRSWASHLCPLPSWDELAQVAYHGIQVPDSDALSERAIP